MPHQSLTSNPHRQPIRHPAQHLHIASFILIGLAVLLFAGGPVSAQEIEPAAVELAEISPYLETELATDDAEVSFLVVLKDQLGAEQLAVHAAAAGASDREARLAATYAALTDHAAQSQANLRGWLDERGIHYRPFYIANMIEVVGDADLAGELRRHPDVDKLIGNPQIQQAHLLAPAEPALPAWVAIIEATLSNVISAPQSSELPYGLRAANADDLWAMGYTGEGIIVASQDTGVEWDHPALQPRYRGWNADAESGTHTYNWLDAWGVEGRPDRCEQDETIPCDDHGRGHGTHTVGTMLGNETEANAQVGMAPDAQWIGCRNMRNGVGTPASYITCFEFFLAPYPSGGDPAIDGMTELAPHIVNNSWSCPPYEGCDVDTLQQIVETVRAAGIFVVSSAGNEGYYGCSSVQNPIAIYDASCSVGAYDVNGNIAAFSSRGPVSVDDSGRLKPDISAPGVATTSATINGGYTALSGTSMASPHVAGATALLWSAVPDLIGDLNKTEQALFMGATPVPVELCSGASEPVSPNPVFGYGRLDALASVELALHPATISVEVSTTAGEPITGTLVSLTDTLTGYHNEIAVDASRTATFEDVLAGAYKVEVWHASERVAWQRFQAETDGVHGLRLIAAEYKLFWPQMAQN